MECGHIVFGDKEGRNYRPYSINKDLQEVVVGDMIFRDIVSNSLEFFYWKNEANIASFNLRTKTGIKMTYYAPLHMVVGMANDVFDMLGLKIYVIGSWRSSIIYNSTTDCVEWENKSMRMTNDSGKQKEYKLVDSSECVRCVDFDEQRFIFPSEYLRSQFLESLPPPLIEDSENTEKSPHEYFSSTHTAILSSHNQTCFDVVELNNITHVSNFRNIGSGGTLCLIEDGKDKRIAFQKDGGAQEACKFIVEHIKLNM